MARADTVDDYAAGWEQGYRAALADVRDIRHLPPRPSTLPWPQYAARLPALIADTLHQRLLVTWAGDA